MLFDLLQNLWIYGTVGRRIFMLALMLMTMSVIAHEGVPIHMKTVNIGNTYSVMGVDHPRTPVPDPEDASDHEGVPVTAKESNDDDAYEPTESPEP